MRTNGLRLAIMFDVCPKMLALLATIACSTSHAADFASTMHDCNTQATSQNLMGNARKTFMSECLNSANASDTNSIGQVSEKTDKFTGEVTYNTKMPSPSMMQQGFGVEVLSEGNMDGTYKSAGIMLARSSPTWRYLQCYDAHWLLDGKPPVGMPKTIHQGRIGSGYVLEFIIQPIPSKKILEQFASASKIEYEVCNDQSEFSTENIQNLRALWMKVKDLK